MAVNSLEKECSSDEVLKNKDSKPSIGGDCEAVSNANGTMNANIRKDRRKPALELYCPKARMINKNCKIDEGMNNLMVNKEVASKDGINSSENVSSKLLDESKNSDSLKISKGGRSRRPDMQVYVPKAKAAAERIEKKNGQLKKENKGEVESIDSKKCYSSSKNNNHVIVENKCVQKKSQNDISNNLISKHSNSSSPLHTSSWADLMEESDLSTNPRSTPEEDLYNHHSDGSGSSKSYKTQKNGNPKIFFSFEEPRIQRSRRNSLKNENHKEKIEENYQEKSTELNEKSKKLNVVSTHEKFQGNQRSRQSEKISRNRSSPDQQKSVNLNIENKNLKHVNDLNLNNIDYDQRYKSDKNRVIDNKLKSDRKKKEKEQNIPPRFQKNKSQNSETSKHSFTGQNGSGGILKIPPQYNFNEVKSEITENGFSSIKAYPEPHFINKQLFNPNNPSKPEIVNIPASVPSMLYDRYFPQCFPSENPNQDHSSFLSAPMPYIPPPQPVMNNQYNFSSPACSFTDSNSIYMEVESIPPPIQCPVPTSLYNRPIGCYNEISTIATESRQKRPKPFVEKNLREIKLLTKELSSLYSEGHTDSSINAAKQCRWKLQLRYENIILADPKYCAENNSEQMLWKLVYYQLIESLRKKLEDNHENHDLIRENLLNIILEGTMFYENLLEKQEETFGFKLSKILEHEYIGTARIPEHLRIVLISVQKSLIYLGDLARYKEQVFKISGYGKARSWYLKAQQIAPKNGIPYHHLAVLALNTKRKLDAIYYYMRSLAASNPYLSAKESLLTLFYEARKKYELFEAKRTIENVDDGNCVEDSINERCEIWIKNDGSSNQLPADTSVDSSDLTDLSDIELNRIFIVSFLHVHGKLFTKVGMETFPDVLKTMLKQFQCLLQRTPLRLTATRILQLLAINIFSVANSSQKENGRERGGCSLLQEQALYTSMMMMSLLMDHCVFLLVSHKSSPDNSNKIISDDLVSLLPAIKIWTDWMSCQKTLWCPPSSVLLEKWNIGMNKSVWSSFANLLTSLGEIDTSNPVIINQEIPDYSPLILEEDVTFAGFVPVLEALHCPAFVKPPFDKEKAKHIFRISRIQFFGDYLCGISPSCMNFDVESKKYISLIKEMSLEESFELSAISFSSTEESGLDDSLDRAQIEEELAKSECRDELEVLWLKKEALRLTKKEQEQQKAQVQAVLQNNQSRPVVLEITPKYLVPDTNCFIDHLCHFKNILSSTNFHVVIPLVVINELDGLARGKRARGHSSPEHTSRVTALSREAILFLEQQFASHHPRLRSMTSQCSILDTISFRSEEMGKNKGTNDDLILNCCLSYCKDRAENYMPKNPNDSVTLSREVVLLTDDRNLRIKALAHHVPVRDLLSFLQWANS
ncbi:telomerase-binding protein EST1A [Nephila pilipes]|uniref:Telomerase-binding protein EST1A n=1 Tax=Nephila pilipes TaxID=299642 RepID=A0A8X6TL61_NEPPI|nr:telomerase-binding protein EST1A [Nephila pilipes]